MRSKEEKYKKIKTRRQAKRAKRRKRIEAAKTAEFPISNFQLDLPDGLMKTPPMMTAS